MDMKASYSQWLLVDTSSSIMNIDGQVPGLPSWALAVAPRAPGHGKPGRTTPASGERSHADRAFEALGVVASSRQGRDRDRARPRPRGGVA